MRGRRVLAVLVSVIAIAGGVTGCSSADDDDIADLETQSPIGSAIAQWLSR